MITLSKQHSALRVEAVRPEFELIRGHRRRFYRISSEK
jgi:hypothetical protein